MNNRVRYLKYRLFIGYRWLIQLACSRLSRDHSSNICQINLVAGAAISGINWLENIIASQIPCRIMFEPFHSKVVSQYRQFNNYHYMHPEETPELYEYH